MENYFQQFEVTNLIKRDSIEKELGFDLIKFRNIQKMILVNCYTECRGIENWPNRNVSDCWDDFREMAAQSQADSWTHIEGKRSGSNIIKLLVSDLKMFVQAVFVPGKLFKPSLMFVGKSGSLPEWRTFQDAPFQGRSPALPTNIRLVWKSLPGTIDLARF